MDLPVRILTNPLREPVVFVDGLAQPSDLAVLELSHWPGNRTPQRFRHDLSSGAALRFAQEPEDVQREYARAATGLANDHFDTDGCLALFVLRHPDSALARADAILDAAAAGDFFQWPTDRALAIDATVAGLSRSPASFLGPTPPGETDPERWNRCLSFLLGAFPALLDGDLAPFRDLWQPVLDTAIEDREGLRRARREELPGERTSLWTLGPGTADDARLPGRHALFGSTPADRALTLADTPGGTLCRLILSTRSWFDLESQPPSPRPDLESLALALNRLETTTPADPHAWRTQPTDSPSPELWFGTRDLDAFAEHNASIRPSRLAPHVIRSILAP